MSPLVGVIMGSRSDWETMQHAVQTLEQLGVPHEVRVVSANRTPDQMFEYAASAEERGLEVIIAGAGGAAHLPGMIAALTHVPVLGVPVKSKALSGEDSLLSIVQMPAGVPVGTLAIGKAGATNAGLLAAAILATHHRGFEQFVARKATFELHRLDLALTLRQRHPHIVKLRVQKAQHRLDLDLKVDAHLLRWRHLSHTGRATGIKQRTKQ